MHKINTRDINNKYNISQQLLQTFSHDDQRPAVKLIPVSKIFENDILGQNLIFKLCDKVIIFKIRW